MRSSLLILLCIASLLFWGFSAVRAENQKDAPPKSTSEKGWEIYAKFDKDKKDWRFGLLRGTNRVKAEKEIAAATTLEGVKGLHKELEKLAAGEHVFLHKQLPEKVRKEIEDACTKQELKLTDVGR